MCDLILFLKVISNEHKPTKTLPLFDFKMLFLIGIVQMNKRISVLFLTSRYFLHVCVGHQLPKCFITQALLVMTDFSKNYSSNPKIPIPLKES
jgi:hypothetical protein